MASTVKAAQAAKLSQAQILADLGVSSSSPFLSDPLFQRALNQQAAAKGLPDPFSPSAVSALVQDLAPIAAIGAAATLPEVAAGEAGAAEATGTGSAATDTAGGVAGGYSLASALAKLTGAAAVVGLVQAYGLRLLEILGGLGLVFLAVKTLGDHVGAQPA